MAAPPDLVQESGRGTAGRGNLTGPRVLHAVVGIEIPIECFMALPEADTYALRSIIADALREELEKVNIRSVDVGAPSVLRNWNKNLYAPDGEPRIIFQAALRFVGVANSSAIESSVASSYVGATMAEKAEEKISHFRRACRAGPSALRVVPRGMLSPTDLVPAHRGDFMRAGETSVAHWPWWLPMALICSGGMMWVVTALYFGRSFLQECRARQYKAQLHPDSHDDPECHSADAIVVPGGGLMPSGDAPPWTEERLLEARALYEEVKALGKVKLPGPRIITHNAWNPVAPNRSDYFGSGRTCEADVCASFLRERCGLPLEAVLADVLSFTLIGNAYFCRTMYAEPHEMRHVAVVTNGFQMRRAKAVFAKIFSLPPLPRGQEDWCTLSFRETADAGLDGEGLAALREQERVALRNFESLQDRFTTLDAVRRFLEGVFTDAGPLQCPGAYAVPPGQQPFD